MKRIKIAEFEIISGKAIVSDPCYEIDTWCQAFLGKVKNGTWSAYVLVTGDERVAKLLAFTGKADRVVGLPTWEDVRSEIGVDSGQCGIFDAAHYQDDAAVKSVTRIGTEVICASEPWYSLCCDRTLSSEHGAGAIPYGCVSSSGYGDGSYRCYIQKDGRGRVFGIKVEFIADEETEE